MPEAKQGQLLVRDEHQRRVGVLEDAVDDHVVVGEELVDRLVAAVELERVAGAVGVLLEGDHPNRVDRGGDGGDLALGQDRDVVHTERRQRRHRAASGRTEADHAGPQRSPVLAGDPGQLQRVQDRAVAGEFVVLVEDVQVEGAVGVPVVHRLPGDDGRPAVDRRLGQRLVLDAVRPAPEHLALAHLGDIGRQRLRLKQHVALGDELLVAAVAGDQRREVGVAEAEAAAVAVLEVDALAQGLIDVS